MGNYDSGGMSDRDNQRLGWKHMHKTALTIRELEDKVHALEAEVAELREDRERLDWVMRQALIARVENLTIVLNSRAALDSARANGEGKTSPPPPPPPES